MGHSGPSLDVLWKLSAVPAVLLVLTVVLSFAVLTPWGPEMTDERVSALWVLLAALIASLGGFVGALLVASSEERTRELERGRDDRQAMQADAATLSQEQEAERQAAEREVEANRLRLESTIQGIKIFEAASGNRIVRAGAFGVIVELGKTEIALRMLDPALEHGEVDASTAVWIIDQVLQAEHIRTPAKRHAAFLLLRHTRTFTSDSVPGAFAWPSSFSSSWPDDHDEDVGLTALWGLADLLTSRPRSWWTDEGGDWLWVVWTMWLALQNDPADVVKDHAACMLRTLTTEDSAFWRDHWLFTNDGYHDVIAARDECSLSSARRERLQRWMRAEEVVPPSRASADAEAAASPPSSTIEAVPPRA